jgi:thioredoxin-like negative regulator of GroEL
MIAAIFSRRPCSELEPHARLVKLNLDHASVLAVRLRIHSIPTLAIFDRGREIARASGAMDQARLVAWARSQLANRQFASEPGEDVRARAPHDR